MKYWTRRNGSQRASEVQEVSSLHVDFGGDGSTAIPVLWIKTGNIWHAIEFENESEAKALMSNAAHIFRGVK